VIEAMLPFFRDHWGNPSSVYLFGNRVGRHMEEARTKVAALIQADPGEIVFTSCGTESNNTAIFSALLSQPGKRHMVTTSVEHSANIKFCRSLEKRGYECTFLPVESDGSLDLHLLETSIRPDTAIVSVMWANNETGVIFPVEEIAALCRSKGVLCHTDAVQAAGKVPIDAHAIGVDMLSLSGHKIHAPKGIGMLYLKRRVPFHPYILGGQQEKGRRAGTENVPYIVAFGRAAELALEHIEDQNSRIRRMRDRLETGILKSIRATSGLGAREPRLPNTANISFDGVEAEAILMLLDQYGICASSGSACTTGSLDPSHVLTAMGLAPARARGCVRFSLGFYNTESDVDLLLEHLPAIISKLRSVAPASSPVPAEQVVPSS
jgi:cysteine desulfurase